RMLAVDKGYSQRSDLDVATLEYRCRDRRAKSLSLQVDQHSHGDGRGPHPLIGDDDIGKANAAEGAGRNGTGGGPGGEGTESSEIAAAIAQQKDNIAGGSTAEHGQVELAIIVEVRCGQPHGIDGWGEGDRRGKCSITLAR